MLFLVTNKNLSLLIIILFFDWLFEPLFTIPIYMAFCLGNWKKKDFNILEKRKI